MAVQFIKNGDACDMIDDLDGLFRRTLGSDLDLFKRTVDSYSVSLNRLLQKRCYILNGVEICDTVGGHAGDFGLPAIDKGCNVAKAASAIAGVSWYIPKSYSVILLSSTFFP
jgi:hypothetical protein